MGEHITVNFASPLILVAAWTVCVAFGAAQIALYEYTPGPVAKLPVEARLHQEDSRRFLLQAFFHPSCDCSFATLDELEPLLTKYPSLVQCNMYFYVPKGASRTFALTSLWSAAAKLKGVNCKADYGGVAARKCGALTSGTVRLIDRRTGKLEFLGGVTPGRGQVGPSIGSNALDLLLESQIAPHEAPVYGCTFQEDGALR